MIELLNDQKKQQKIKLWWHELPDIHYPELITKVYMLDAPRAVQLKSDCAAVELFYHTGGHFPYGLLGATFNSNLSKSLEVQIVLSKANYLNYPDSLARNIDNVFIGLLEEYENGILKAVFSEKSNEILGSGTLRFDCAAYGCIGSSSKIFRLITQVLIKLLSLPSNFTQQSINKSILEFIGNLK